MARSPFSIFTRKSHEGRKVYCVRFFDESGDVMKTKTLRDAKSHTAAARIATQMLKDGVISNSSNPDALEYLLGFWKKGSDYVQGRALRGVTISDRYLTVNRYLIGKHLKEPLRGKRLLDISPLFLEKLILSLSKAGCSARTINTTMQAVKVPYGYFCRLHRLANPLTSVEHLVESPRERGILSADEVGKIIALEGESPRAIAAVLLGALCGMRLGEIRGLQWSDVDFEEKTIRIQHNWVAETEGLKRPKWGSERTVPAPEPVLDAIKLCQDTTPKGSGEFVLWNEKRPDVPISPATIPRQFHRILASIGIDVTERKKRNLCFHGLRHTFVSLSRAASIPDFLVQRMAGHRSMEMTERYSHSEGIIDFAAARASLEKAVKLTKEVVLAGL